MVDLKKLEKKLHKEAFPKNGKRYNVEIFEYATGKTEAVIGRDLSEAKAERREMTGLSRCNSNFGCRMVEI